MQPAGQRRRGMMQRATLRTIGGLSLRGPGGAELLDEPRLAALVVMLAIAGDSGVGDDELLLRLTPDAKADQGRAEIARLIAVARLRLGAESAIVPARGGYALARGVIGLDVRVLSQPSVESFAAFLEGFKLAGSPEVREWVDAARYRVAALPAPKRWSHRIALATTAVVIGAGMAAYATWPRAASGFSPSDRLLVADVSSETGDSVFNRSLMTASIVGLQQ